MVSCVALQMDVEAVAALRLGCAQQASAMRWLCSIRVRIGSSALAACLVGEIHPRLQPDIDAPRHDPDGDVRRLQRPSVQRTRPGLTVSKPEAPVSMSPRTAAPAGKVGIGRRVMAAETVPCRVGLPDLDQRVLQRRARAVDAPRR